MKYLSVDDAVSDIVAKVKVFNSDLANDALIKLYAEKFVSDVLAYCNRDDFPADLTYTAGELVAKWTANKGSSDTGVIKSIKQNDTEFEFAVATPSAANAADTDFNSIKSKLNLYRRVRWSTCNCHMNSAKMPCSNGCTKTE